MTANNAASEKRIDLLVEIWNTSCRSRPAGSNGLPALPFGNSEQRSGLPATRPASRTYRPSLQSAG